uniref:Calcium binding protein 1 n=1 Tax=Cercocebus atys TaxID=9531 RepID=A0A2K5KME4_CERAT
MGGGDGAAFKRPGDGARLQRVLGLGSRRAPGSLPAGGPAPRRTAPPPPGHASAGPAAMSSHIAKSESKTSLLKSPPPPSPPPEPPRAQDVLADGACLHPGEAPTPDPHPSAL